MKEKSGSSSTLLASLELEAMRELTLVLARFSSLRSSSAVASPRCWRMEERSLSFSSLRSETDCWRDSRRIFLRILDRLACSRLRSLCYDLIFVMYYFI